MSVLSNPKHERFAQELVKGKSATEAYATAGFKPSRPNASRLQHDDNVSQRVRELLAARETIDAKATERAIQRLSITKEAVLSELAKIGFGDIRKAVAWSQALVPAGEGDQQVSVQQVRLIDSDKIDDDTAAAIAEVRQSPTGGLSIKMYDKPGALVSLGKHLGLFIERHEHGNPGDFDNLSDADLEAAVRERAAALGLAKGAGRTSH